MTPTPAGDPVTFEAPSLVCAVCRAARTFVRPGAMAWVCPACANRGVLWAAKMAARPWWRRLLRL